MDKIKKQAGWLLLFMFIFGLLYLRGAGYHMTDDNLVVLAASYQGGFLSAGLIGTCYGWLDRILPVDLMTYESAYAFTKGMLVVYVFLAAALFLLILHRTAEEQKKIQSDLILMALLIFGGAFGGSNTMGSFAMYQTIVFLLCMFPLFTGRALWLLIPFSALGMCVHPSFLFTHLPLIVLLTIYLDRKKDRTFSGKAGYIWKIIPVLCVLIFAVSEVSVLRSVGRLAQIESAAAMLSKDPAMFDATWAVRGLRSLSAILPEWGYHRNNYIGLLLFLLFFSPYLLIGREFFLTANGTEKKDKVYRGLQLGALAILPEFCFKVRYGYLICEVMMYYLILLMFYLVSEDGRMVPAVEQMSEKIKKKAAMPVILLLYPILFLPFNGESIFFVFEKMARLFGM